MFLLAKKYLFLYIHSEKKNSPARKNSCLRRSMRLLATKKGMSLSEHGLCSNVMRGGGAKLNQGVKLNTPSEESVFEALGLEYREPKDRNHWEAKTVVLNLGTEPHKFHTCIHGPFVVGKIQFLSWILVFLLLLLNLLPPNPFDRTQVKKTIGMKPLYL